MRKLADACFKSIDIDWNIVTGAIEVTSVIDIFFIEVAGCHRSVIDTVTMFHIDITHACMSASNSHSFKTSDLGKEPLNLPYYDLKSL